MRDPAVRRLSSPPGLWPRLDVECRPRGEAEGMEFAVAAASAEARRYLLADLSQAAFIGLFEQWAADFSARAPASRRPPPRLPPDPGYEVLIAGNLDPRILYGYGDPCVIRAPRRGGGSEFVLTCTSNDAPDAFPILRSADLRAWRLEGFIFEEGAKPAWARQEPLVSDYWAPEIHRVGEEYWSCFAARAHDDTLAIGLAKAPAPEGPFDCAEAPLLTGGVIDPHIYVEEGGQPILYWKEDRNDLWPGLLVEALARHPGALAAIFPAAADRTAAHLAVTLWPWIGELAPMARFAALQVVIEAAVEDFAGFRQRLQALASGDAALARDLAPTIEALTTRIYAQRLSASGESLVGERVLVIENDQPWEAHLIEGMWLHHDGGRYYLFYSGNDFSTPNYGVGVAVAEDPFGPFRKSDAPLLTSCDAWWGPGHPSVALDPEGRPRLFLHAFEPGKVGYKAFRALLSIGLEFEGDEVRVVRKP